jgi:hypothetical protein
VEPSAAIGALNDYLGLAVDVSLTPTDNIGPSAQLFGRLESAKEQGSSCVAPTMRLSLGVHSKRTPWKVRRGRTAVGSPPSAPTPPSSPSTFWVARRSSSTQARREQVMGAGGLGRSAIRLVTLTVARW